MILGNITVYKCDGAGCEATRVVPIEHEPQFSLDWHNGMAHQFCSSCKMQFRNQAAVAKDELAAVKLKAEVLKHAA